MGVKGIEKGSLIGGVGGGGEPGGGLHPLGYFGLFVGRVSLLGYGGHCSLDGRGEPGGSGEET